MFTRSGQAVLATGLALFLGGIAFGNYALLLVGALPVLALLVVLSERPTLPTATRTLSTMHPRRGDVVEAKLDVRLPAGRGAVEVHQPLPAPFELVDGTNLHVLALGPAPRRVALAFRFRARQRGRHVLSPVEFEAVHPLGLLGPVDGKDGGDAVVEVAPRVLAIGRLRVGGLRARSAAADAARARLGVESTDFRELRDYRWGDPPRSINWKATARRLSLDAGETPLVNEHEHEGRTAVWVFVDASTAMEIGTSVDNGLEHAVEAATGVAAWYLGRGHRVGAYVYNARESTPVFSDTGRRQLKRFSETLLATTPAPPEEGLEKAVARCRPHLVRDAPHVVVVTRVGEPSRALLAGLRSLRRLASTPRKRAEIMVVDVRPHRLQPLATGLDRDAAEISEGLDAATQASVRRLGAALVRWDPASGPFAGVFLRRVGP